MKNKNALIIDTSKMSTKQSDKFLKELLQRRKRNMSTSATIIYDVSEYYISESKLDE